MQAILPCLSYINREIAEGRESMPFVNSRPLERIRQPKVSESREIPSNME